MSKKSETIVNLEKEICRDLIESFKGIIEPYQIYKSKLLKTINMYGEDIDNKTLLISVLENKPFAFINEILPYIEEKSVIKEVEFDTKYTDDWRNQINFDYDLFLKIDDFTVITSLEIMRIDLYHNDDDRTNLSDYIEINHDIIQYNHLSGEILIRGNYEVDSLSMGTGNNVIEEAEKKIQLYAKGLLKTNEIPSWIEYLVESCINIEYKNFKMALFNCFAALDRFIEILNEKVFDYYISNYIYLIQGYNGPERIEVENYLKKKIKNFGKDTRRLDEKLRQALKELGIDGNTTDFQHFFKYIKKIQDIEDIRNQIGHGNKIEGEYKIGEVLYIILTVIFSIVLYEDLVKNDWSSLILSE